MGDIDFHRTVRGAKYFDHDFPEMVRQLSELNKNLKMLIDKM